MQDPWNYENGTTIVVTTDSAAMASMSSTIAAPRINLASLDCILPNSVNTWTEIAILVAVSAVATSKDSNFLKPNIKNTRGETPPFINSLGVISSPAINRITIAEIYMPYRLIKNNKGFSIKKWLSA